MKRLQTRSISLTSKCTNVLTLLSLLIFAQSPNAFAQVSAGGQPYSILTEQILEEPSTVLIAEPDVVRFSEQDAQARREGQVLPYRYGYPIDVDLGLENAGSWIDLPNNDRLWRLRIVSPGATSIFLALDAFHMPQGAELFVYNDSKEDIAGAFTSANNKPSGVFSIAPIPGDAITLEYREPADVDENALLHITRVVHGFRGKNDAGDRVDAGKKGPDPKQSVLFDYGDAASCHININCSQGSGWQDEKRAVAMILTSSGWLCSGALINNENNDWTPYFLTADHCLMAAGVQPQYWIFRFNYESSYCTNQDGPYNQTISGARLRANYGPSDFALLELMTLVPTSYDVYFSGWSRSSSAPASTVGIHHPNGDIKKISLDSNSPAITAYTGGTGTTHWEVRWNQGITANGSSGSPLFDPNGRIIGQLHGGTSFCHAPTAPDWYGRLSVSWNGGGISSTRLKDWLDPDNTGLTVLDGIDLESPEPPTSLTITNAGADTELVELGWTASTTTGVDYEIERCQAPDPFSSCPYTQIASLSGTSYTDTGVLLENPPAPGEPYWRYRVRAEKHSYRSNYTSPVATWGTDLSKRDILAELSDQELPKMVSLEQNYPNPFNPFTEIQFGLPEASHVTLTVYDTMGREVEKVLNQVVEAGVHRITWNAAMLPSGVYIYQLVVGNQIKTKKMALLK